MCARGRLIVALRKRTRQVVSLRSGPMGASGPTGARFLGQLSRFGNPGADIRRLVAFYLYLTQGRRPGRRRSGTRFEAPDGCNRVSPGRPPYQGVWGMGKENTRRSRSVFTRSPAPSHLLVTFGWLQKSLAPQGETFPIPRLTRWRNIQAGGHRPPLRVLTHDPVLGRAIRGPVHSSVTASPRHLPSREG